MATLFTSAQSPTGSGLPSRREYLAVSHPVGTHRCPMCALPSDHPPTPSRNAQKPAAPAALLVSNRDRDARAATAACSDAPPREQPGGLASSLLCCSPLAAFSKFVLFCRGTKTKKTTCAVPTTLIQYTVFQSPVVKPVAIPAAMTFSSLDKMASMAQLMSIVNHQKAVSNKLNGCSGVCVVGATAGLSVRGLKRRNSGERWWRVVVEAERVFERACSCHIVTRFFVCSCRRIRTLSAKGISFPCQP